MKILNTVEREEKVVSMYQRLKELKFVKRGKSSLQWLAEPVSLMRLTSTHHYIPQKRYIKNIYIIVEQEVKPGLN